MTEKDVPQIDRGGMLLRLTEGDAPQNDREVNFSEWKRGNDLAMRDGLTDNYQMPSFSSRVSVPELAQRTPSE